MIKRLRLGSALLWTAVIMVLCWTPQIYLPVDETRNSLSQILHLDKVVHAGIFLVFSVLWLRALPAGKRSYLYVLMAGIALAAVTELVQNVPIINREGEMGDAMTDVAGVLAGFPLFRILEDWLRRK